MVCLEFEPGSQDGRRRYNHGAMAAATISRNFRCSFDRYNFVLGK